MHRHHFEMNRRGFKKLLRMFHVVAKAEWSTFIAVIVGTVIYSFGVMVFTVPFRFPDSGVTGIAVLLNYSIGFSVPLFVAIVNVGLLSWAWKQLSLRLVLWTVFAVVLNTALMRVFQDISVLHTDQRLLVALIGGAIKGYGGGLVLRAGASLGGLDIIVLYLQKRYGVEVGKYTFYINMFIIGIGTLVVGVENAMLGFVAVYTSSLMIDNTISSFDRRRLIFVVTYDPCPVVQYVNAELSRGATLIDAHGGYSGEDRPMVMCLLTRRETVELKRFLADNQPRAFMVVSDASEVVGKGFKPWR